MAAAFLILLQLSGLVSFPMPPGLPNDFLNALIAGFVAGVAGGMGYEVIDR